MKKVLIVILIVLEALSGVVSVFSLLAANWLAAVLALAVVILGIVPLVVLIEHMDELRYLREDISQLQTRVRRLEKQLSVSEEAPIFNRIAGAEDMQPKMTATSRWACVKCGAVNREHTAFCENCGAHFSEEQGQVADTPLTRWRLKNKKKK